MRAAARHLVLAVIGGIALVGGLTAPAQAALIKKPVTTGYVQLTLDSPLSTAMAAKRPGRTTPNGMFFPVSGVTTGGVSVSGDLSIFNPANPAVTETYPIRVDFDRAAGTGSIVLAPTQVPQTVTLFTLSNMVTDGPKTSINAKKKVRIVTTTWIGDVNITNEPTIVSGLNSALGMSMAPGDKVGSAGIKVTVTTPCKNAACTK